ncbi:MAG: DUF2950 domain-containing protein [Deltaproteobacteria bacterium]|nr:DUF2950 domain-containing protein [Deltaproteobacteria bacterium]
METIREKSVFCMLRGMAITAAFLVTVAVVFTWSMPVAGASTQRHFSSPEEALKTLVEAVKAKDETAIGQIFGPSGKDLHSGDKVQDAAEFDELARHLAEKTTLVKESDSKVLLHIGNENWPFPIPIVRKDGQWFFDTEAGKEEILNRRIGENELTAILVCRTYVKAQREYTLKDWDGDGIFAYAQKLRSAPGKRNGLFWRASPGESVSPLGELVAKARMEGYKKEKTAFKEETPTPFHGYYFKILTRQGKNVPGGKYNYIINGNMVGGFALVAFPSNWGKSGVMTFIVNQQGKVNQKNIGPNTTKIAREMKLYNPDKTWTPAKE